MADNIVISAVAEVIDKASAPLRGIMGLFPGMQQAAKAAGGALSGIGSSISGVFTGIGRGVSGAVSGIARIGSGLAGLFGPISGLTGLLSAGGLTAAITSFANTARDIGRTSRALGVTTDFLQTMRLGVGDAEAADRALKNLRQTLTRVGQGGKAAQPVADLLAKMGVNAEMLRAGRLEEMLPMIAAGFAANVGPQQQAAAAQALFGKAWVDVLPLLQKGPEGLLEAAKRIRMSTEEVARGEEAAKALRSLGDAVERAKNAIVSALLPAFTPLVEGLTKFIENNRELLAQVALPGFITAIGVALAAMLAKVVALAGPWGILTAAIVGGAVALYQNWGDVKKFMDENLGGMGTALETAAKGFKSWAKQTMNEIQAGFAEGGAAGGFDAIWRQLKSGATDAFKGIGDAFTNINWANVGQSAATALFNAWKAYMSFSEWVWEQFGQIDWNAVLNSIAAAFKAAWTGAMNILDWLGELDWATVGETAGRVFVKALIAIGRALLKIGEWFVNVDWGEVGTAVFEGFMKLLGVMGKIGLKLITGLVKGMVAGLDLSELGAAIRNRLENLVPGGAGGWLGRNLGLAPTAANTNTPLPVQAANAQRGINDLNVNITTEPGTSAEVTSNRTRGPAAPANVDVGQSTYSQSVG
jgi:hypothetical protein